MRNSKSFLLLLFMLIIITMAFVLVAMWGYQYYFNNDPPLTKKSGLMAPLFPDTTKNQPHKYSHIIVPFDSGSSRELLGHKLEQLTILQAEIDSLLLSQSLRKEDEEGEEGNVEEKELRRKVEELREKNNRILRENQRLQETVGQLSTQKHTGNLVQNRSASAIRISNLRMNAITDSGAYTTVSERTRTFRVYFLIKSKGVSKAVFYVVILKPDGSVLAKAQESSGTFQSEDRKIKFSEKLIFMPPDKNLQCSLKVNKPHPGTYIVEVYYAGRIIGSLKKTLR